MERLLTSCYVELGEAAEQSNDYCTYLLSMKVELELIYKTRNLLKRQLHILAINLLVTQYTGKH